MNLTKIDNQWFRGRLADRRLSQRQLARLMNLDPSAVSLMLRGKRKASSTEVAEIARLLGVSADDVVVHLGSAPTVPAGRAEPVALVARDVTTSAPQATPAALGVIELPVPMADGSVARLSLPRGMRKEDAERIATLVRALAVP